MSEENSVSNLSAAVAVNRYKQKVDSVIDRIIGVIGDHPWERWLDRANGFIGAFLPAVIGVAGLLAFLTSVITAIKCDARFSDVIATVWILFGTLLAMHLAPKALSLMRSFIEKGETEMIRPELAYILKVVFTLGSLVMALYSLLTFSGDGFVAGLLFLVIAVLSTIVFSRPGIVGFKFAYPTNCVEEVISIVLLPVKLVFSLLTPIIAVVSVIALIGGIVMWFSNGMEAAMYLGVSALAPVLVPLAAYVAYLMMTFVLDLYRSICSMPRKIDELKEAIRAK